MAASAASLNIVNSYYRAILRTTPSASLAQVFATQLDGGTLTANQLEAQLLSSAQSSTIPALETYDIFYNATPATSGVDFLTNYALALQAGAYTYNSAGVFQLTPGQNTGIPFSLQNVYVNLGATFAGDPNSTFSATYGSLGQAAFVNQIYSQIFGVAPAASTQQFLISNLPYYTSYAGSAIGGYGAIAGLLLSVADASGLGQYPAAAKSFLGAAAISTAAGGDTAKYGSELIAAYGNPTSSVVTLTTAVDNVTGNTILADLTPFLFNGIGPTLNVGDRVTGSAGLTNNTFDINDQFGTGTDVIPAGVFISNVQNINLTTQGNAGGQSPITQVGVGTASGVFDVTSTASTQASTISGVKAVNVLSAGAFVDNVRVDPGTLNPVDVTVNHQHVNGTGGVAILGGNNITVSDGDGAAGFAAAQSADVAEDLALGGVGALAGFASDGDDFGAGLVLPAGVVANAGVTIGSPTVVNTNNINLNPLGAVKVSEIGNNQIFVNGGTSVTINDFGGGVIMVGQPTGAQLSYPSDEPVGAVTINDSADTQAGDILVFSSAPITNGGTTTNNVTTATINETALLASGIDVGALAAVGGIVQSYSPAGNDSITVAAQTPVNYDFIGKVQSGIVPAVGLTPIVVVGGATDNVTTNANSVSIGSATFNGLTPVANQNAAGNVTVTDTAVVGVGAGGAFVTDFGGINVNIANAGGAVTIGAPVPALNTTVAPSGTETVVDTAPRVYDDVINLGTARDVTAFGGTTVSVTTNSGAVTIGTAAGIPLSEPTGAVTVVDTASPGVNAGGKAPGTDVPITIFGGTTVTATSANGSITIGAPAGFGAGTPSTVPSGPVTATTNGIETGGQFNSFTTVNGGASATINTTGAGGAVTAGSINAATGVGTPIAGPVTINDTFAGTQNADSFTVFGGVGVASSGTVAAAPAVSIITTATSGNINVGNVAAATLLNNTGTALANPGDFANGNVTIVNETPAGTGVAGTKNLWGKGGTEIVNVNGPLATTVSMAGGGFATITDEQTTKATGGSNAGKAIGPSSLATVNLDHVGGGLITTDALANLTVIDDPGTAAVPDIFTVADATSSHPLALTIGNDGTGTVKGLTTAIVDPTAGAVTVAGTVASTGTIGLSFAGATAVTFNETAALNVALGGTTLTNAGLAVSSKLTSITLNNTGTAASIALGDLSGLGALATITAGAASTGAVSATLSGATAFAGGGSTGTDKITLNSNAVTATMQAGGGANNAIIANYAANAGDTALGTNSKVLGFSVLGVGANAVSTAFKQTVTLGVPGSATTGAAGDKFTVTANNGHGGTTYSFTYTEQAGDSAAAIAAALAAGLAAKAAGDSSVAVKYTAGSTSFSVVGASAVAPVNPTVTVSTTGAGVIAASGAQGTLNNYDATSFNALTVGPTAGPIGFSNVGANETLNIAAALTGAAPGVLTQPQAVTLAPAGLANSLTLNIGGPDGAVTNPAVFTNATVNTSSTQTVTVNDTGEGATTKNTLTLTDPALTTLKFTGDESVTVTTPGATPLNSLVTTIDASATTNSTQPGSTNTVDVTGVPVAITGVTVTGGQGVIKAAGVQGLDSQNNFVTLSGIPDVGDTLTVTITSTTTGGVTTTWPAFNYTVVAGDIVAGNDLATEQNIAGKIATLINTFSNANPNFGVTASSNPNFPFGVLSLVGQTAISSFTDTASVAPSAPAKSTFASVAATAATKQIDTLTLTAAGANAFVTGDVVSVTVNGTTVSYTVVAADTDTTIATALTAAINGNAKITAVASAASAGAGITITGNTNGVAFTDVPAINFSPNIAIPATFGVVGTGNDFTAATDKFSSGAGGGTFTLGAGGGFNPFAVNAVTSGVITTKFIGLFDSGFEQANLALSTAKVDTINVSRDVIATNNGVNGGILSFQDTASTVADRVLLTDPSGYTELANAQTTKFDFTDTHLAHAVAALDPSGKLANNLANASYSIVNGVITIVGAGNNASVDDPTKLAGAELVVALAAAKAGGQGVTAGTGIAALVTTAAGNTYVVAAALNDNLYNSFNAIPAADATASPPVLTSGTPNSNDPGLAVVELLGVSSVNGFGSSVTLPSSSGPPTNNGITSGLGATGAILANVQNILATHPDGTYGNAGKNSTYDDSGVFALDQLTTAAGAGFVTTYNNLAPAAQLNVAAGGAVGDVTVAQGGAPGSDSLIVDLKAAANIGTLTVNNDWAARLVADAGTAVAPITVSNFTDASNIITTVQATGVGALAIGAISGSAVTTVDASGMTDATGGAGRGTFLLGATLNNAGFLTATPVNTSGLVIKGALGGDTIFANGGGDTITVGSQVAGNSSKILGPVNITAAGNKDVVTLGNEAAGSINFLTVGGASDIISVDNGTNNIAGGFTPVVNSLVPAIPAVVPLQANDTINLADGGTDNVWVGGNATVNLTGNSVTVTPVFGTAASTANIQVTGDTTGTTSAGFASGAANPGAITTISGADLMGAAGTLNLTFLNAGPVGVGKEVLAGGLGSAAGAFVNVQGVTSLAAALDLDVNQSLTLDAQLQPTTDTTVAGGALQLNANTGILSWFQFSGNTYVVEATNATAAAATHAGLQAGDTVVKLAGLVDVSHATLAGGILSHV